MVNPEYIFLIVVQLQKSVTGNFCFLVYMVALATNLSTDSINASLIELNSKRHLKKKKKTFTAFNCLKI